MKKTILLNKLSFFFSILLFSFPLNAGLFKAEEFYLDNGLRVVVVENHKAPIIKQMIWYNVGSVDDGLGKGGRAHFLEHLMFRGTNKLKDGEFDTLLEDNGVISNAFTSYEVTAYHEFADISKLELLMAVEADRMRGLNFDKEAFNTEKQVVIQERKQVIENNPAAPFSERFRKTIWGDLPFGHPVTGLTKEMIALSYEDVKKFYNIHYAPNNAILVLAGDIDVSTAKTLAEKYFGSIKRILVKGKRHVPVLKERFSQRLEMSLPHIQTPKIIWRYILPTFAKLKGFAYDYEALAQYLGAGITSALYRDLVLDKKIALSVGAGFHFVTRSNTEFSLYITPAEGISTAEAENALEKALEKAIDELDEKKLASVKKKMGADWVYSQDNPSENANMVGNLLSRGFSLDILRNYEDDIKKVTLTGVKNAYTEIFSNSAKAVGILLPQPEEEKK